MYVSRYIRKMPGKNADAAWEKGFYCPKCPACGYASETGIPLEHKNSRGYRCINKEGNSAEYRLSHDFKTDVAKITFATQEVADINVMLSVLYALLEGLSREMGIERTDIKGCLFYTSVDGCMIFSVVLYDAVAGGAGHVRRIVTADGQAFQRVLAKAISVVDNCRLRLVLLQMPKKLLQPKNPRQSESKPSFRVFTPVGGKHEPITDGNN